MTKKVSIKNFKSVKNVSFGCKKINLFIGEPNTGKSNILEALTFLSPGSIQRGLFKEIFRFKTLGNFFYDEDFNKPVHIATDSLHFDLSFAKNDQGAVLNHFSGIYSNPKVTEGAKKNTKLFEINFTFLGDETDISGSLFDTSFRAYIFKRLKSFSTTFRPFLNVPFGDNLPSLLTGNTELKKMVSDFFRDKGLRIQLKPAENDINIAKDVNEELYSYPYEAVSETLQRIVFMMLAIESNKNSSLILDEPEANTFPFYTKYIAERIALDETNQFFITTHNPYLLMSIIEKAKLDDLNVFVCQLKDYETKLTLLKEEQLQQALDLGSDVFFNLNRLVD
jgi:AAA15 family ATPase/GTPase